MVVTKVHIHFSTTDDEVMRRKFLALLSSCNWVVADAAKKVGVCPATAFRIIREDKKLHDAVAKARYEQALKE